MPSQLSFIVMFSAAFFSLLTAGFARVLAESHSLCWEVLFLFHKLSFKLSLIPPVSRQFEFELISMFK